MLEICEVCEERYVHNGDKENKINAKSILETKRCIYCNKEDRSGYEFIIWCLKNKCWYRFDVRDTFIDSWRNMISHESDFDISSIRPWEDWLQECEVCHEVRKSAPNPIGDDRCCGKEIMDCEPKELIK